MTDGMKEALEILAKKELLLTELVAWMKAKGLWEQAVKDLGWRIE